MVINSTVMHSRQLTTGCLSTVPMFIPNFLCGGSDSGMKQWTKQVYGYWLGEEGKKTKHMLIKPWVPLLSVLPFNFKILDS